MRQNRAGSRQKFAGQWGDPLKLQQDAKRRLPLDVFDFVEGGSGNELALNRNRRALDKITIQPNLSVPEHAVSLSTQLFGITYSAPIGIAPIGLAGLIHPSADMILAKAAARRNWPFILSCASSSPLSRITKVIGHAPWYQLYAPSIDIPTKSLLSLPLEQGCPVLVLTVDMSAVGRRLRDVRNGFSPARTKRRLILDFLSRPAWAWAQLKAGRITFPNMEHSSPEPATNDWQSQLRIQTGGEFSWDRIQEIRDIWPNRLLLKGVLRADIADEARRIGVDGVIVSNHGGRQLDCVPASIETLPAISNAIGQDCTLLDSGIYGGEDILRAIMHGAKAAFIGRLALRAVAAGGEARLEQLLNTLTEDTVRAFAIAGLRNIKY